MAIVITGGGRGVGAVIAESLAQRPLSRGLPLILVGRNEDTLREQCKRIEQLRQASKDFVHDAPTAALSFIVGDVSDPVTADRVFAEAERLTVGIEGDKSAAAQKGFAPIIRHLICNAGIGKAGALEDISPDVVRDMLHVNCLGSYYLIRRTLQDLKKGNDENTQRTDDAAAARQCSIVCLSSVAAIKTVKFDAGYSASKAALSSMTEALAQEQATKRRANVEGADLSIVNLCPSFIESEMTERSIAALSKRLNISREDARERIAVSCPGGEILSGKTIADAVYYTCFEESGRRFAQDVLLGKPWTLRAMGSEEATVSAASADVAVVASDDTSPLDEQQRSLERRVARMVNDTRAHIRESDGYKSASHLVVSVSGGTDSALVLRLLHDVYPNKVRPVLFEAAQDHGEGAKKPKAPHIEALLRYAREVLKCPISIVSLPSSLLLSVREDGKAESDESNNHYLCNGPVTVFADELRWASLVSLSKQFQRVSPSSTNGSGGGGAHLVGTRNLTEDVMGTYSLASTQVVHQPLLELTHHPKRSVQWWKADVLEACRQLELPTECSESSHKADPECGRPQDMAEIGIQKMDRFAMVKWSGQEWLMHNGGDNCDESRRLTAAEIGYLTRIYDYNSFKRAR